jgi:hypothetical protein
VLGNEAIRQIDEIRRRMRMGMTREQADALAARVSAHDDFQAEVSEREGFYILWVSGTPEGGCPISHESDWEFYTRKWSKSSVSQIRLLRRMP